MSQTARQKCLTEFQKLRRLQESDSRGFVRCISSGKPHYYKALDGAHFIPRGNRCTELEPDNIWPQSHYVNRYKSEDPDEYRIRLIQRIGIGRVERLENMLAASRGSSEALATLCLEDQQKCLMVKNNYEYNLLAKNYRKQCRELEREKGIA